MEHVYTLRVKTKLDAEQTANVIMAVSRGGFEEIDIRHESTTGA